MTKNVHGKVGDSAAAAAVGSPTASAALAAQKGGFVDFAKGGYPYGGYGAHPMMHGYGGYGAYGGYGHP